MATVQGFLQVHREVMTGESRSCSLKGATCFGEHNSLVTVQLILVLSASAVELDFEVF